LDTRRRPWPGQPDRSCDTVAWLRDRARNGLPWAAVVEFQFAPDAAMFGRLLVYLDQVWLELRPGDLPGDRFCVTAVVVNLTGRGNSGRQLEWPEAGVVTTLKSRELDLSELRAEEVLNGVAGPGSRFGPRFLSAPLFHDRTTRSGNSAWHIPGRITLILLTPCGPLGITNGPAHQPGAPPMGERWSHPFAALTDDRIP